MNAPVTKALSPEERELQRKHIEVAKLEEDLAQRELELETYRGRLIAFEQRYLQGVGVHLAELDEIEALLAEAACRLQPLDGSAAKRAASMRAQATESAAATSGLLATSPRFRPSDSLKQLYREVAKRVHPDLAFDEEERRTRVLLMAEANAAYQAGDEARLRAVLDKWSADPRAIRGEGIGADLVRIIRRVAQIEGRIVAIASEFLAIRSAELSQLMDRVDEQEARGIDALAVMAARVKGDVERARGRLRQAREEEAAG